MASVVSAKELAWAERYWKTANYLAASAVYLKDNFLLERKLKKEDIKRSLLGHWGTCPGINFVYTHLNLLVTRHRQQVLVVVGPGHGFAAVLANLFLEGTLGEYYPAMQRTKKGVGNVIQSFCWPGGFPSHLNPGVPGCIHEGGELGYALAVAFGAAFDHPRLLVVALIGDGEAETGPTATAWHSAKFINPAQDGAVLPILHLNGYKINSPSIYATMSDEELRALFTGYGYEPLFVGTGHQEMAHALEQAYQRIITFQERARAQKKQKTTQEESIRWPMLILKTPKGWTGVKSLNGKKIEGSWRSHQVPLKDVRENPASLRALEHWLRSYKPSALFPQGSLPKETLLYVPQGTLRIGNNPYANGGALRKPLVLPSPKSTAIQMKKPGAVRASSMETLGCYLKEVLLANAPERNFRIMSPDELASNRLSAVLEVTGRRYARPSPDEDSQLSPEGRVMEMLSEHTLQGWLQGYLLSGRHGIFPSYEAFLPIIDSMASQYLKFIISSAEHHWRVPISSLNYLLTSVCWRQDHNGFSHQNPGFITTLLNKAREEKLVRLYFPADANMTLAICREVLESTNRVNAIIADKQQVRQWQSYDEAVAQAGHGASIWKFASQEKPDLVLAACGDVQTQELLATIALLREQVSALRVRFVNVSELNVLGAAPYYPNALDDVKFREFFTPDKHVLFAFHGYPETVKQLLFDRPHPSRFHVYGYTERGTTTTPFDMLVRNGISRYHFAKRAVEHAAAFNAQVAAAAPRFLAWCEKKLAEHREYILREGHDPEDLDAWTWK